jgi:hypothetical protein
MIFTIKISKLKGTNVSSGGIWPDIKRSFAGTKAIPKPYHPYPNLTTTLLLLYLKGILVVSLGYGCCKEGVHMIRLRYSTSMR